MLRRKIKITGIIGLSPNKYTKNKQEFLHSQYLVEKYSLDYVEINAYGKFTQHELRVLAAKKIDILIVAGWQRLIPQELIDSVRISTVGIHGSDQGIEKGRGRSPQNWALLLEAEKFLISIFQITQGIDNGKIINSKRFNLSPLDDIYSCHIKVAFNTVDMIEEFLNEPEIQLINASCQSDDSEYFPKRIPEDGLIDWNQEIAFLEKFVSALTKPYPGAFAYIHETKIFIWRLREIQVFDNLEVRSTAKLLHILDGSKLIIQTPKGICLVDDFSIDDTNQLVLGCELRGTSLKTQLKKISDRHKMKYPNLKIAPRLNKIGGKEF